MSYTRRMGNFPKQNTPLSSVGQRRPPGNQYAQGGQNKQQQQQQQNQQFQPQPPPQEKPKPIQQQVVQQNQPKPPPPPAKQQQPQPPPMQQQNMQQQQNIQQQKNIQQQQNIQPQQNMQPPQQHQQGAGLQQVAEKMLSEHVFTPEKPVITTSAVEQIPGIGNGAEAENGTQQKNKPFWMKRNVGRVNKAERAKRRNVRLRKLLQPKNALMIINELVGHVAFQLSETKNNFEDVYKASVMVEGSEFTGFGKSKVLAKSSAAESAVRTMILNKLRITATAPPAQEEEENKDVKMEVTEENQEDVSWTHIASFAIHKLFSSWGEDGNVADMISRSTSLASLPDTTVGSIKKEDSLLTGLQSQQEQKPAKKLPENAALMNPIMLLNQMHPSAKYEEVGKNGNPPNVQFTMRCTIGNQSFVGVGSNKKAARKQASFEACKTLLGIEYPPEILDGTATTTQQAVMDTS